MRPEQGRDMRAPQKVWLLTGAAVTTARLGGIGGERITLAKAADAGHRRAALLERVETAIRGASSGAVMCAPGAVGARVANGEGQSCQCDCDQRAHTHRCLLGSKASPISRN